MPRAGKSFFLSLVTCALSLGYCGAIAQQYPSKPVRLVVPYAPAGPVDEVARLLGQRLTESLGGPVIVDNRAGAGGGIGTDAVAKAPPDGYTLLIGNSGPMTINPALHKKIPYEPQKDLAPVTLLLAGQMVLAVHPSVPARSVKELVALARARPGQVNFGSIGVGNLTHLAMELFQSMAKVRMNHVPYKGAAPAYVDLVAGNIEVLMSNIAGTVPQLQGGRLRAVAVSSAKRAKVLPEVPAIAETYPGYDLTTWMGIFTPAGTPQPIVTRLHGELVKALQRSDFRDRVEAQGSEILAASASDLAALINRETRLYANIIKTAGIPPQ
jgi:tripartite-type tricarboxylate transporter receptor subunit TctC